MGFINSIWITFYTSNLLPAFTVNLQPTSYICWVSLSLHGFPRFLHYCLHIIYLFHHLFYYYLLVIAVPLDGHSWERIERQTVWPLLPSAHNIISEEPWNRLGLFFPLHSLHLDPTGGNCHDEMRYILEVVKTRISDNNFLTVYLIGRNFPSYRSSFTSVDAPCFPFALLLVVTRRFTPIIITTVGKA